MKASEMMTVTELSQETGIDRYLIWYYVRKLGIIGDRVGAQRLLLLSPSDCERIKMACGKYQLERGGVTVTELAKELDTSRQNIWLTIERLGHKHERRVGSRAIIDPVLSDEIRRAVNDRKANK